MNNYDLIIIGGGPGGYHAADLAGKAGLKTLVIEKHKLGGVCLNEGCIPSKALLNSAKHFRYAKHGESYGVYANDVTYNQKEVVQRKNNIVKTLVAGVGYTLKTAKVTVVSGLATILKKDNEGFKVQVGSDIYVSTKLIIASGSSPVIPPIEGLAEAIKKGSILTSREILDLTDIPKNLTVIGGGVIGLEMATYFAQIGSKVTVVEMLPTIGGPLDLDISKALKKVLESQGITFKLNAKVTKVSEKELTYVQDNQEESVTFDYALLSVGRRASTSELGLENLYIDTRKNGSIITDDQTKTNVANVYAIGDVNGKVMLAHTAYKEAEVCINTLLGKKDVINYDKIPSVIYTSPEVCSIGYTELVAKEKGYDVKVISLPVSYSGRHLAESNDHDGFVKLVVDQKRNTLLGAHMLSLYASEISLFLSAMMHLEINIEEMKRIIYPHPTVGELVKDALFHI